jgi:putative transposase
MSWMENCVMDERVRFVAQVLGGPETMSGLCRQFGISRKTGYKWLDRYRAEGAAGLHDHSRAPRGNSRALGDAVVAAILAVRHRYPSWGPRKVKAWLEIHHGERAWPPASSIGNVFDRAGLTRRRRRRRGVPLQDWPLSRCRACNDVWCIDFKGWFRTGDGVRVDPLTLSDAHSRYLLRLEAVERPDRAHVWPVVAGALREFGLPRVLRSDNGPPFASRGVSGLSRLAVQLIKAGVLPERIEPGKPQQNGRHERMHLTLKQDTASPPAATQAAQIARFRDFLQIYNHERPHEALGQRPPGEFYRASPRVWDGGLRSPDYPDGVRVRRVRSNGEIKWKSQPLFISKALEHEPVGLYRIDEDTWEIRYGPIVLGTLKGRECWKRN